MLLCRGSGGLLCPDSRHFRFNRNEKFICFSNLATVLADTRMPARLNCWAILPVVLRVHLHPLTGSPGGFVFHDERNRV